MDKNQPGTMSNPEQLDLTVTAPNQRSGFNFQPLSNDEIEYFAGNMPLPERIPNFQQRVLTNMGNLSAPTQTDPAWLNHAASPAAINQSQWRAGSVTSQTNSSQSSPEMMSPDSVSQHSAQTSPNDFGHGNFANGPGFVLREVGPIERRLGTHGAPQHRMPQTYNMASEVGFNPMVHNRIVTDSAANLMEGAPVKLGRQETFFGDNGDSGAVQYQNVYQTHRKREFGVNGNHHESYKIHRSSQLHGTRFEGAAEAPWRGDLGDYNTQFRQYDTGVPCNGEIGDCNNQFRQYDAGVPWQWNYRNQRYGAQEHGTFNNYFPWQGNYNNQRYQGQEQGTSRNPGNLSTFSGTTSQFSMLSLDTVFDRNVSSENANQTGPTDQVLTGNYRRNLRNDIYQPTNNSAVNYFDFNPTNLRHHGPQIGRPTSNMPAYTQQWIPDNNDNLGLMDLDWEYPKGICNFGTYSNHVGVIDPWKEIKAERALALPISATILHPVGNNEGESLSQEAEAYKERLAARKKDDPNLTTEEQEKEAVKREANRKYWRKSIQKKKGIQKPSKNKAERLPKKISDAQQYRRNIEKNMLFVSDALEKRYPDFLSGETTGYRRGMLQLRNKFKGQKSLDLELFEAREKHAAEKQKFRDAAQEYKQGKSTTEKSSAASRQSRANGEVTHWENVCKVLDSQWALRYETKLAELATLYVQRTMPTVISKLKPIFNNVREQCYQTEEGKQGFEDFMKFLKKHRNLFMVRRNSLPSGSMGFVRM